MGLIYNTDKRSIIPRWRNHNVALVSGEISPIKNNAAIIEAKFSKELLVEQIFSWNKFGSIHHAADLFSSAYTLGIESEFLEVANFLYENRNEISKVLLRQINGVLNFDQNDALTLEVNFDFFSEEGKNKTISELSNLRSYLKKEPKNPLAWVELARNHSLLGNFEKSANAMHNALHVNDTSDRFVLRSASRFFHHLGDDEQAHSIIRKAKNLKDDPWLISCEIGFSTILNRRSGLIKSSNDLIKSQKFSHFQISELASAIATAEFLQGNIKNAKSLFKTALIAPNDNSLAQVLWFEQYLPFLGISEEQLQMPLAFEAQTQSYYKGKNYKKAYESAIRWLNDEPYSTRPVRLASYISTIFLKDNNKSIEILKHGLKVNPKDLKLLNSLCYNLLLENKIVDAEKCFQKIKYETLSRETVDTKIAIIATTGLYNFRINNIDLGRSYYLESLEYAAKQKNDYLHAIAIANYVREEIIIYKNKNLKADKNKIEELIQKLVRFSINVKDDDFIALKEDVLQEYHSVK